MTGGRERMAVFLEQAEGQRPSEDRLEALQCAKQRHYSELVAAGEIRLRPGVLRLMGAAAAAGVRQAIVTTSGRSAVEALLSRQLPQHQDWLEFWVCGEDVAAKNPTHRAIAVPSSDWPAALIGCWPWRTRVTG